MGYHIPGGQFREPKARGKAKLDAEGFVILWGKAEYGQMEMKLRDYRRAGLHLPKADRDEVEKLRKALSAVPTEFRTSGNPMSYRTANGRQLIVIATGAGPDARLVAFGLPE